MDISSLSEREICAEIARLSGVDARVGAGSVKNPPDYLKDMNALMPLIFENRICLNHSRCLGLSTGNVYASDMHGAHEVMKFEDPPRALAECLLRVLRASNDGHTLSAAGTVGKEI